MGKVSTFDKSHNWQTSAPLILSDHLRPHFRENLVIINQKENVRAMTSNAMCWQTVDYGNFFFVLND